MSESEALQRKQRSIEILKSFNVPYIEHLPVIETSDDVQIRDRERIAKRAVCILYTIQFAIDQLNDCDEIEESYELFHGMISDWGLIPELTDKEKLVFERKADKSALIQIAWQYEAYWVLAWAMGLVETLDYPSEICNVDEAIEFVSSCKSLGEFMESIKMRSTQEILDQADLIFRYHWACVDARLKKMPCPAGLDVDVVMERHIALNWLIGDEDWDNVSTNT